MDYSKAIDEQLTTILAEKVLGWYKWKFDNGETTERWPELWLNDEGLTMAFVSKADAELPSAMESAPRLGDGLTGVFDPLYDHNDMNIVEQQLINRGWQIVIQQDKESIWGYLRRQTKEEIVCEKCKQTQAFAEYIEVSINGTNKLRAEARAIAEAIEKEQSSEG